MKAAQSTKRSSAGAMAALAGSPIAAPDENWKRSIFLFTLWVEHLTKALTAETNLSAE